MKKIRLENMSISAEMADIIDVTGVDTTIQLDKDNIQYFVASDDDYEKLNEVLPYADWQVEDILRYTVKHATQNEQFEEAQFNLLSEAIDFCNKQVDYHEEAGEYGDPENAKHSAFWYEIYDNSSTEPYPNNSIFTTKEYYED